MKKSKKKNKKPKKKRREKITKEKSSRSFVKTKNITATLYYLLMIGFTIVLILVFFGVLTL